MPSAVKGKVRRRILLPVPRRFRPQRRSVACRGGSGERRRELGAPGPTTVALWHLDEQPGATVAVDSSGRGHHGAIGTDVLLGVPGRFGSAFEFPGPSAKVTVPTADDLNPYLSPLTVSAYLWVPSSLTGGDYNVLQKGQANAVGGAYKLEIVGTAGSNKFGYPDCAFNSPGGAKNRVYGPKRINDGTWHQVECHLTDTQCLRHRRRKVGSGRDPRGREHRQSGRGDHRREAQQHPLLPGSARTRCPSRSAELVPGQWPGPPARPRPMGEDWKRPCWQPPPGATHRQSTGASYGARPVRVSCSVEHHAAATRCDAIFIEPLAQPARQGLDWW